MVAPLAADVVAIEVVDALELVVEEALPDEEVVVVVAALEVVVVVVLTLLLLPEPGRHCE